MLHKTWNVRDQTNEELEHMQLKLYSDIDKSYKLLKKVSKEEDAIKLIREIWSMKRWTNEIDIERTRRWATEAQ